VPSDAIENRAEFVDAMARAGSCVTVVTTDGPTGRHGITVCAMASVSCEPPTLLVCINKASRVCAALRENQVLCVNLLAEDQCHLSEAFAGRKGVGPERFALGRWLVGASGAPILVDALAAFDCRVQAMQDASTHVIFVALVLETRLRHGSPLLYHDRRYHRLERVEAVAV
jgi:flavin reductase